MPSGYENADFVRDFLQVSVDSADEVGGSFMGVIYSIQRDPLVMPVLQHLVVFVNPLLVNAPVGFEGTNHLPAFPPTEFDQFGRSISGVKQDVHLVAFGKQPCQFYQHLTRQGILGAITQVMFWVTLPVETAHGLLPHVQTGVKGKTNGADLDMDFDIHIPIGIGLLLVIALAVIVTKVYRLQVTGRFVFFTQAVVHARQDCGSQPQ